MTRTLHSKLGRPRVFTVYAAGVAVTLWIAAASTSNVGTARAAPDPPWPEAAELTGGWTTWANADDILTLHRQEGVLWAGTRAGGLVRWDPDAGTYVQFLAPQTPLAGNTVYAIVGDEFGRLWLGTAGGLSVLDHKGTADTGDDEWTTFTRASTQGGLPSDAVRALAFDGTGLWVGGAQIPDPLAGTWSQGGLGRIETHGTPDFDDDTWASVSTFESTRSRRPDNTEVFGLVSDTVTALAVVPGGHLWVGTVPHWRLVRGADASVPDRWLQVHGGITYVNTKATADTQDDEFRAYSCESPLRDTTGRPLVACSVQAMAVDAADRVWAAVGGLGIVSLPGQRSVLTGSMVTRFDRTDGVDGGYAEDIAPTSDGQAVWIGLRSGGVRLLDHRGSVANKFDDEWRVFTTVQGLSRDRIQAVSPDESGAWLGTGPHFGVAAGLDRLELNPGRVARHLITAAPHGAAPPSNFITSLDFAADGVLWLGTGSRAQRFIGRGVAAMDTKGTADPGDDTWKTYTTLETDDNGRPPFSGLSGDNVHSVRTDADRVWVGSVESRYNERSRSYEDGGLSVYQDGRWTARTVANTGGAAAGLRAASVSALTLGCSGELWVGTSSLWSPGAGVDVLDPGAAVHSLAEDAWTKHTSPALASDNTRDIATDCDKGEVWVAGVHQARFNTWVDGGAAVFAIGSGRWTRHDTTTGMVAFRNGLILGEGTAAAIGLDGDVHVGSYGTLMTTEENLIATAPYSPAVINTFRDGAWSALILDGLGSISSVATDPTGRVWAGTTRGGTARQALTPEGWFRDYGLPGLVVRGTDGAWRIVPPAMSAFPPTDVAAVAVAPGGSVWVATEGLGVARYLEVPPTPTVTPTSSEPTPTATRVEMTATPVTATSTATGSPDATATPTGSVTGTPSTSTPSQTATLATPGPLGHTVYLPWNRQP